MSARTPEQAHERVHAECWEPTVGDSCPVLAALREMEERGKTLGFEAAIVVNSCGHAALGVMSYCPACRQLERGKAIGIEACRETHEAVDTATLEEAERRGEERVRKALITCRRDHGTSMDNVRTAGGGRVFKEDELPCVWWALTGEGDPPEEKGGGG